MTNEVTTISRVLNDVVGKYAAEFDFKIAHDARISADEIRRQCMLGADDLIAALQERAPQVLLP